MLTVKPKNKKRSRLTVLDATIRKKGGGNKNYQKGYRFEWEFLWYLKYHSFDPIRSYASKGVCDIRAVPPRSAKITTALGAQCKNQKNGDYLSPKERLQLQNFSNQFNYIIIEPFKANNTCYIKIRPWELHGPVMTPEEFLKKVYGINAMSWREFKLKYRTHKANIPYRKNN